MFYDGHGRCGMSGNACNSTSTWKTGNASALIFAAEHPTQPENAVQPLQDENPGVPMSSVLVAASINFVIVSDAWSGEKNGVTCTAEVVETGAWLVT